MTSPANPFDVPYGYQFQDGDDWDWQPHWPSLMATTGLPWQGMAVVE